MKNILKILDKIGSIIPAPLYWEDVNSTILGANQHVIKGAGVQSLTDFIGKSLFDLYPEEMATNIKLHNEEVMKTGQILSQEEKIVDITTGEVKYFTAVKAPLYDDDGTLMGVVGTSIDITYLKKIEADLRLAKEKAEAANEAKTMFIANMSHDVRGPVAGVIGLSKLLEVESDIEHARSYGHMINQSSERLLGLLNDILEMIAAEEIAEDKINTETFSLSTLLLDLKQLLVTHAATKNIEIFVEHDKTIPEFVMTDRIKLYRILLNIINNAIKFTQEGFVSVKTQLRQLQDSTIQVAFIVEDTGIGIPEDKIDKIFDRFFKINPSYTNQYSGYGIGLFIMQKFVNLLGGKVTVTSIENKGTIFEVVLPMKIGHKNDVKKTPSAIYPDNENHTDITKQLPPTKTQSPQNQSLTSSTRTVMIVEDDNIARLIAKNSFANAGFNVVDVISAEAAFNQLIEKPSFDLVVTDIGLPGMDGNQLAELIRCWENITEQSKPLPIVGLTAHGVIKKSPANVALNALFSKPITEDKINEIVDLFLPAKECSQAEDATTCLFNKDSKSDNDLPESEACLFQLCNYPLFDKIAGTASAGTPELLTNLLEMLANSIIPEELIKLEEAHKHQDWKTIQTIAHKLKGGACYCGTIKLRFACQYLERYLLAGHNDKKEELYLQLLSVLKETSLAIKPLLENCQ